MNQILELVLNENMKIYKKSRTWILMGLLLIINLMVGLFVKILFGGTSFTIWDHLEISSYLLILVLVMGIIQAGDSVASEFHQGTIKLLLIRPASRAKVLTAKYISVCLFLVSFVLVHFVTSFLAGVLFFTMSIGFSDDLFVIFHILALYFFGFIEILVLSTMAFMFSVVSRNSVFAIVLPIFIYFTSGAILTLLSHYKIQQGKFILFANTDLTQHLLGRQMFEGMTWGFSLTNLAIHMLLFFVISYLFFARKDVHV